MIIRQSKLIVAIVFSGLASIISADASLALPDSPENSLQEMNLKLRYSDGYDSPSEANLVNLSRGIFRRGVKCPQVCFVKDLRDIYYAQNSEHRLDALMPKSNIGTTLAPNPTIVWFIPEDKAQQAEFYKARLRIFDRQSIDEPYSATFKIPKGPSIVKFELPEYVELKSDTTYIWRLDIYCDYDEEKSALMRGILKRQELDKSLEVQLQQQEEDSLEKVAIYVQGRIWNEALLGILSLREEYPEQWQEFLNSVELEHLADFPVLKIEEIIESPIPPDAWLNEVLHY